MQNFTYHNPVRIIFGKGEIAQLPALVPAKAKILLVYGGGSIKKNGVYAQVTESLKGFSVTEFSCIEPNPEYDTCMKAVALARDNSINFLLAVGGGSVIDATKFIAAAIPFEGDPWDLLAKQKPVTQALPVGTVLTLPATGSEMNGFSVISRRSLDKKLGFHGALLHPEFSILDPETTYSLPKHQLVNGIIDTFVHVTEQYVTHPESAVLQERQSEAILLTLREVGPKLLAPPPYDYDTRANYMWAAASALNSLINCGVPQDWATHQIGHEITAFFGLDHALSLAVVLPALWTHQKELKKEKLAQYGRRVWGLAGTDAEVVEAAIQTTRNFFEDLGAPTRLSAYSIPMEETHKVVDALAARKFKGGDRGNITPEVIKEIMALAQ